MGVIGIAQCRSKQEEIGMREKLAWNAITIERLKPCGASLESFQSGFIICNAPTESNAAGNNAAKLVAASRPHKS